MMPVVEFIEGQVKNGIGSEAKYFRPLTWYDFRNDKENHFRFLPKHIITVFKSIEKL